MQQTLRDSASVPALDTRQGSGKHRQIARALISVPDVFHIDSHITCCSYNTFPASLRWRRFFYPPRTQRLLAPLFKKESTDDSSGKTQKISSELFQKHFGSVVARNLTSDIGSDWKNDWKSAENSQKASENAEKPSVFLQIRSGFPALRLNACQSVNYNLLETRGL